MSDKIRVQVEIKETVRYGAYIEITREEYDEWCERIDNARGFKREDLASEMMDFANIDHRHGDYSDSEIEEFCEIEAEQAAKG
jgi:hypothetical protein